MSTEIPRDPDVVADFTENPFIRGRQLGIMITNPMYGDPNDFSIRAKNFNSLVIQIINRGGAPVAYEIYGTLDRSETAPPFSEVYTLLENASGTVADLTSRSFQNNLPWSWVLVRLKQDVTQTNTEVDILYGATF